MGFRRNPVLIKTGVNKGRYNLRDRKIWGVKERVEWLDMGAQCSLQIADFDTSPSQKVLFGRPNIYIVQTPALRRA